MAELEIPKDISVGEFFEDYVPRTFHEVVKESPVPNMEGTEFTLQVNLTGEGGGEYGVIVRDAKEIEVKKGSLENPMLTITAPVVAWRATLSGDIEGVGAFTNPAQFAAMADRQMYEAALTTRGTVIFKPEMGEGLDVEMKITFNGAEQPSVTLRATPEVLGKMSTGELSGPEAFMQGALKIDGDISFAMQLNAFMRTPT